jgi:hypothetical protein
LATHTTLASFQTQCRQALEPHTTSTPLPSLPYRPRPPLPSSHRHGHPHEDNPHLSSLCCACTRHQQVLDASCTSLLLLDNSLAPLSHSHALIARGHPNRRCARHAVHVHVVCPSSPPWCTLPFHLGRETRASTPGQAQAQAPSIPLLPVEQAPSHPSVEHLAGGHATVLSRSLSLSLERHARASTAWHLVSDTYPAAQLTQ